MTIIMKEKLHLLCNLNSRAILVFQNLYSSIIITVKQSKELGPRVKFSHIRDYYVLLLEICFTPIFLSLCT